MVKPAEMVKDIEIKEIHLAREMNTFQITLLGYGAMVGASIFVLAGIAVDIVGSGLIVVIILNFLVSIVTAYSYAEQSSRTPEVGGGYQWVKEATNDIVGFISGWTSWLGHCIACSFYIITISRGIIWLFGIEDPNKISFIIPFINQPITWEMDAKFISVIIAIFFLYINFRGVNETSKSEYYVVLIQIAVLGIFSFLGALRIVNEPGNALENFSNLFPKGLSSVIIAMALLFIAFEGYEICVQTAEEAKNPRKTIPRAIFISIILVTITYLIIFFISIAVFSSDSNSILVLGKEKGLILAAGQLNSLLIPLMILAMIFGGTATLNSTIYSSSRVALALARDNNLPKKFLEIHPIRKTPWIAIYGSGAIIIFMALFLPFNDIIASADVLFLLLFIFVNYSAIIIRKRVGDKDFFTKTPFFPLLPVFGIISLIILVLYLFFFSWIAWLVAVGWILLGLIIKELIKKVKI